MRNFYQYRKWLAVLALSCGILAGLSTLMFIPYEMGLCRYHDSHCRERYENKGGTILAVTFPVFILGSFIFVHTRNGKRPWRISLVMLGSVGALSVLENITHSEGGFGLSFPSEFVVLAIILGFVYGAYLVSMTLKELLERNLLFRRIGVKTLAGILLTLTLGVFMTLEFFWL